MDVTVVGTLVTKIAVLQQEIDLLREKLSTNSENSSIPPSKSFKRKKIKKEHKKSDRKHGAQPGHVGTYRKPASDTEINNFVSIDAPKKCPMCDGPLSALQKSHTHQVHDLENNQIKITEYQLKKSRCCKCRRVYSGTMPTGVSNSNFGHNIAAHITSLVVRYHLSKKLIANIFKEFYNFHISVGSVSNIERIVSTSLYQAYENCATTIKNEEVVHADETRHLQNGVNHWAWVAASSAATVFLLDKSRGKKVALQLVGKDFSGTLISDRYAAYNFKEPDERQICWSHLKRDFKKISERSGAPGKIGKALLFYQARVFKYWNKYKEGVISFITLGSILTSVKKHVENTIYSGTHVAHQATAKTCKNLLKVIDGLWTFALKEGVEPTNNHAEQQIRSFVIYRKLSFGTRAERGTVFLQRAFSIAATCKKQQKKFIQFVRDSMEAFTANSDPPLLFA